MVTPPPWLDAGWTWGRKSCKHSGSLRPEGRRVGWFGGLPQRRLSQCNEERGEQFGSHVYPERGGVKRPLELAHMTFGG